MILDLDKFVMIIIKYVMQPLKSAKVIGFKSRVNVARNVLALQVFMETSKENLQKAGIICLFSIKAFVETVVENLCRDSKCRRHLEIGSIVPLNRAKKLHLHPVWPEKNRQMSIKVA